MLRYAGPLEGLASVASLAFSTSMTNLLCAMDSDGGGGGGEVKENWWKIEKGAESLSEVRKLWES